MSGHVQAWVGNVVALGSDVQESGGWLTVHQGVEPPAARDRQGRQAANQLFGAGASVHAEQMARQDRLLTDEQLWMVYKRTPDVRAAIDAIARRVATWNWLVEPTLAPSDSQYGQALEESAAATKFLKAPNTDGETWQELWTKVILDLMVFDAGVIENVFTGEVNKDGVVQATEDLAELVALKGSTVFPRTDSHGHLLGYVQNTTGVLGPLPTVEGFGGNSAEVNAPFGTEQIVYMRLFPNTSSPLGVPLIETLINEIIALLRQSEHTMLTFDADEIPPGILVLTGIAGKAAAAAKADLQKLRGKDHKVRVITNPDPKATGANWVELRRTAKDVDFVNVVDRVRRTVWRVFGVLPVEMGASENMPRAVGQVQLEVSGSHLINPILELVEAKINARILPLVTDKADSSDRIKFRFDRESKLSADDQSKMANTLTSLIREGVLSRNEARKIRGDQPIEGGDVITITTGQGTFPLTQIVAAPATGVPTPDSEVPAGPPEGQEPAPGEASRFPMARGRGLLPSEWQPAGPFEQYRTLDLPALGDEVMRYRRLVDPLYDTAHTEVVAAVRSMYRPGGLDDDAAARLIQRVAMAMDKLERSWAITTKRLYLRTAKLGQRAARDFTGMPVLDEGLAERATQYGDRAMQFLTAPGGILSDIRARLSATVSALTTRAKTSAPAGLGPLATEASAAEGVSGAFVANHHRIDNWGGRLVELANSTMVAGMLETGASIVNGEAQSIEWMAEWVSVGDRNMCQTCTTEGSLGFRPLAQFQTVPGADTECRARCRCVLILWTRPEVDNGTAVSLSGRDF